MRVIHFYQISKLSVSIHYLLFVLTAFSCLTPKLLKDWNAVKCHDELQTWRDLSVVLYHILLYSINPTVLPTLQEPSFPLCDSYRSVSSSRILFMPRQIRKQKTVLLFFFGKIILHLLDLSVDATLTVKIETAYFFCVLVSTDKTAWVHDPEGSTCMQNTVKPQIQSCDTSVHKCYAIYFIQSSCQSPHTSSFHQTDFFFEGGGFLKPFLTAPLRLVPYRSVCTKTRCLASICPLTSTYSAVNVCLCFCLEQPELTFFCIHCSFFITEIALQYLSVQQYSVPYLIITT